MNRWIGTVLCAAAALGAMPQVALAQGGDLGIGMGVSLTNRELFGNLGGIGLGGGGRGGIDGSPALGGLELTYWLNDDIAIDILAQFATSIADRGDARFDIAVAAGVFFALAQGDDTKFELGGRLGADGAINPSYAPGAEDEDLDLFLDIVLRVEHWFDSHFTMTGEAGLSFAGDPDATGLGGLGGGTGVGFSMGIGGQAGVFFHYYFDGNARPGSGARAPMTGGGGGYGGGGGGGGGGGTTTTTTTTGGGEPMPDPESGAAGW